MTQPQVTVAGSVGSQQAFDPWEASLQIAVRASSLAEQTAVVAALGSESSNQEHDLHRPRFRPAGDWEDRLTAKFLDQHGDGKAIAQALDRYRLTRSRAGSLSSVERQHLTDMHHSWATTYATALETFSGAPDTAVGPSRSAARDRIRIPCEPFTQHLQRMIADRASEANDIVGRPLIGDGLAAAFGSHLLDRFELAVAWALEAHANLAFARSGLSREQATPAHHESYFRRAFTDASRCHDFFVRFPVLGRWLATVTGQLIDNAAQLIARLTADADTIGEQFFGEPVRSFTSVDLGKGDSHRGGNSVAILHLELESSVAALVYKPRALDTEVGMQRLLKRLSADGVLGFAPRKVVAMRDYGYEELIPQGHNAVESLAQAAEVFEQLGGFLAVFYVLGGSDLHHENVIVADGHAYVCDCETVLGIELPGHELGWQSVADSVFRTGLLEWPLPATAEVVTRLSGYSGGQGYEVPFPVPTVQDGSAPMVRHKTGVRVEEKAGNRVRLGDTVLDAGDFEESIVRGFTAVHDWFRVEKAAPRYVEECFAGAEIRYVARNTQAYGQLLIAARHPRCLVEPLEVDFAFRRLLETPLRWDVGGKAGETEVRSMWQLDVPVFTMRADHRALLDGDGQPLGVTATRSPLEVALARIESLSSDDQLRQVSYIAGSLSSAKVCDDNFVNTALDWAQLVGDELSRRLEDSSPGPRWTRSNSRQTSSDIAGTLYYGSAGVALFLAYLDALRPSAHIREAARRALNHALRCPPRAIGAFDGLAGQAYVLSHLHALWSEQALWELAVDRITRIERSIDEDRELDVLSGCAGVIAVTLAMSDTAGFDLEPAHRSAQRLLDTAVVGEHGLSWPSSTPNAGIADLTGFAHGTAGIGWALIRLGAAAEREDYVKAGLDAFAYERHHFDSGHQDWRDLRASVQDPVPGRPHFGNAWCNGAPGIGLSRLESWIALGRSEDVLCDESWLALAATLRGLAATGNDTLCHGISGNSELLLRTALHQAEPAFQLEANVQAQAMWRRLAASSEWPRKESGHDSISGLMVGIAGIGMHCLRLAAPDRVPSPLLLDPPALDRARQVRPQEEASSDVCNMPGVS